MRVARVQYLSKQYEVTSAWIRDVFLLANLFTMSLSLYCNILSRSFVAWYFFLRWCNTTVQDSRIYRNTNSIEFVCLNYPEIPDDALSCNYLTNESQRGQSNFIPRSCCCLSSQGHSIFQISNDTTWLNDSVVDWFRGFVRLCMED